MLRNPLSISLLMFGIAFVIVGLVPKLQRPVDRQAQLYKRVAHKIKKGYIKLPRSGWTANAQALMERESQVRPSEEAVRAAMRERGLPEPPLFAPDPKCQHKPVPVETVDEHGNSLVVGHLCSKCLGNVDPPRPSYGGRQTELSPGEAVIPKEAVKNIDFDALLAVAHGPIVPGRPESCMRCGKGCPPGSLTGGVCGACQRYLPEKVRALTANMPIMDEWLGSRYKNELVEFGHYLNLNQPAQMSKKALIHAIVVASLERWSYYEQYDVMSGESATPVYNYRTVMFSFIQFQETFLSVVSARKF